MTNESERFIGAPYPDTPAPWVGCPSSAGGLSRVLSPFTIEKIKANTKKPERTKKALLDPVTKASATPVSPSVTAARLGSKPSDPIVVTTIIVTMAIPATEPEFRSTWVSADTTP